MATFYNSATLSYNGLVTTSNVTTGNILEILTAAKTAVRDTYSIGDDVTYIISMVNSGTSALTGLTVTDDLGAYSVCSHTVTPLTFRPGSVRYFVNGVLQPTPDVDACDALVISGLRIPAGGSAILAYEAIPNQYAPPETCGTITNVAVISGKDMCDVTVRETITVAEEASLAITKSLNPTVVVENEQITYTFVIQNSGNTKAGHRDDVILRDDFNPVLRDISVTYNGCPWTVGTNYSYNTTTGEFASLPGQITVPAATFTQDRGSGRWSVNPGVSTLTITGTLQRRECC